MSFNPDWEQDAENWIAWARTPGHDACWLFRDSFLELVPSAGRATLDLGCGEGRLARDLASRGHRVTGVDASPTLLRAASQADAAGDYVLADAAALPFADASFDLIVAYNSLMDVQDMPGAVDEAARVLEPSGRFCVCVTHPLADAGRFEAREADAPFVIQNSYFGRRRPWYHGQTFERAGLRMAFHGWAYAFAKTTAGRSRSRDCSSRRYASRGSRPTRSSAIRLSSAGDACRTSSCCAH
jgi:ubiquinone/menaquinone biosynthesis C-methylase UbiE